MPQLINKQQLDGWMSQIHTDWQLNEKADQICRKFSLRDYYQTMAFANSVAWIAQQNDHHPDMHISYKTCVVEYTTHSAGGLTELDFKSAQAIDQLLAQ